MNAFKEFDKIRESLTRQNSFIKITDKEEVRNKADKSHKSFKNRGATFSV